MRNFLLSGILVLSLFSCLSEQQKKQVNSFESALEAKTGNNYEWVRISSSQKGYVVYHNKTRNTYEAYNLDKWDGINMSTYADFESVAAPGDVIIGLRKEVDTETDSDGRTSSTTYYIYGGLYFSNNSTGIKDLDLIASMKDEAAQAFLSHRFKSEFSLSTSRADELAKVATRFNRLENRRALTANEKDKFAMDALGVSMTQVERAMKQKAQGNEAEYESMLETAARVNKTTPEQVGRFFDEMAPAL